MAEIVVGDVVARLRIDASGFDQALTQAQQRLSQLQQTMGQLRQGQTQAAQTTQQTAQALLALAQALSQQVQVVTQAASALQQLTQALMSASQGQASIAQSTQQSAQAATALTQAITAQARAYQQLTQAQAAVRSVQAQAPAIVGASLPAAPAAGSRSQVDPQTTQTSTSLTQALVAQTQAYTALSQATSQYAQLATQTASAMQQVTQSTRQQTQALAQAASQQQATDARQAAQDVAAVQQRAAQAQQAAVQQQQVAARTAATEARQAAQDIAAAAQRAAQAQQAAMQQQQVASRLAAQEARQAAQEVAAAAQRTAQIQQAAVQQQQVASRQAAQEARQSAQEVAAAAQRAAQAQQAAVQQQQVAARQAAQEARQLAQERRAAEQQAAQDAAQNAGRLGAALSTALSVAGGIGIATSIGAIISQMKELATSIVAVGVQFQQLRQQFTAIQGVSAGAAAFQQMINLAQRLGIEVIPLAENFRRFDAATRGTSIQGEQAARIFENMVVGMRAMGASSQQTERGLLALQQMVSKGIVSQEELRQQLAEAIPGATQIAARAFGVTTQELNKMIEKGTDSIEFVRRFSERFRMEFGGAVATATDTAAAAFQRLSNEIKLAGETIAASGLLDTLRSLAEAATTLLATLRKVQEERSREAGPPVGALPRGGVGFPPAIRERQAELERLQAQITGAQASQLVESMLPGFAGPLTTEERRAIRDKLQAVDAEQRKAMAEFQQKLQAEGFGPGGQVGFKFEIAADERPLQAAEERIAKILDQGRQQIRDIELNAPFLSALDIADQKFKAWEKTLKAVQEEIGKLGEGLRRTITPSGAPNSLDALIERIAGEKGLDPNLMRALIEQESGFNPQAVSRAGARGLMQLMPGTAAAYGAGGREFEPEANLRAGMSYFAELLQKFNGNVERALTAYNAGPARGGIPLPTGENATFAQDVLRRVPQTIQGMLDAAGRQQRALAAGQEAQTPDTERLAQTRATGREYLQAIEEEERQRDVDARERRQQVMATSREYIRALEEEVQKRFQAVESLKSLERQYSLTADARKEGEAARLAAQFPQDAEIQTRAENVRLLIEEKQAMESSFAAIKARTDAQREAQAASDAMTQSIEAQLERLRAPREERAELRLRAQARRQGVELTPDDEARLRAITAQERFNDIMQITERIGDTAAQTITQGLLSIIDGTERVSDAFRLMAKSILDSVAQIALNEGFRMLIRLGITAIGAAFAPGAAGATGTAAGNQAALGIAPGTTFFQQAQGGAIVNRPTAILAGENPAMNPEYVLNRPQMQALMSGAMRAAPTAGGQAMGGVTVINVANREQAAQEASRERALGKAVIINEVLNEISQGSGSRIARTLQALR